MNFVMFVNIIVGWVYKNKSLMINSRIITAEQNLKELGLKIDVHGKYISVIKIAAFWVICVLFVDLTTTYRSSRSTNFITKLMITFVIHHGYHVNLLIDLTFGVFIQHMKMRFKSINELLLDILRLQDNNLAHQIETDYKWAVSRGVTFEKDYVIILQNIKRIHLQLGIMCRDLTKIYGIPIILTMITAFANITSMLVYVYTTLMSKEETLTEKITLLITLLPWTALFALKFFLINYDCAETVCEWKKTGEIIHLIEIQAQDMKLRKEIQLFSIQILQNPLKFSPCGLLDLGYYFMREFAASVTGQVILSIQTYRFPVK
ncbi:GSCOCT00005241001.3-RA-CDS [Cotesia congregata]|uniref:Gustatory receptor n=1 Tax=Cotesia congregata TaxID=51543 RepID=A0A8J2HM91_COTCN|nr:GSCOCT00005241001.3-RA-CDS [Cotesia congregata]CAG5101806.1 gustatory receptor 25 [Cotesia congregata]